MKIEERLIRTSARHPETFHAVESLEHRQRKHLEEVERLARSRYSEKTCAHTFCTSCHGTGIQLDGTRCIHYISCQCPKCSPYFM